MVNADIISRLDRNLNGRVKDIYSSTRNALLLTDPELLIGLSRLVIAIFAFVAVFLDPTQPASYLTEARITLSIYLAAAALLVAFPIGKPVDSPLHIPVHVLDAAILGWLAFLTEELASPFFIYLPFTLMAMTVRWGLRGAFLGAFTLELVLLAVGLPDIGDGESELNFLIMRSIHLFVAALILGYFGAYRESSRMRITQLAEWPFDAVPGDDSSWLAGLCSHASSVLGGARLAIIWRDQEKLSGHAAYWSSSKLSLVDLNDAEFWSRFETEDGISTGDRAARMATIEDEQLVKSALPDCTFPKHSKAYACVAAFSGVQYRGIVCVIDPSCRPDECLSLTNIIAGRFGAELERFALMEQAAEKVRTDERIRVAHHLHDSILQDLTAANLKIKVAANAAEGELKRRLTDVNSLLFEQQQRIRHLVEDWRDTGEDISISLHDTLMGMASLLQQKWDCRVTIMANSADLKISPKLTRELDQILSEATANAVRHGRATEIKVTIEHNDGATKVDIEDNGIGLSNAAASSEPTSLRRRVSQLGGTLTVDDRARGFGLRITLPWHLRSA